jgi:hypothetical protein
MKKKNLKKNKFGTIQLTLMNGQPIFALKDGQ